MRLKLLEDPRRQQKYDQHLYDPRNLIFLKDYQYILYMVKSTGPSTTLHFTPFHNCNESVPESFHPHCSLCIHIIQ